VGGLYKLRIQLTRSLKAAWFYPLSLRSAKSWVQNLLCDCFTTKDFCHQIQHGNRRTQALLFQIRLVPLRIG
jgi:hypothetical protein